jgi:hypothetical protein
MVRDWCGPSMDIQWGLHASDIGRIRVADREHIGRSRAVRGVSVDLMWTWCGLSVDLVPGYSGLNCSDRRLMWSGN